MDLKLDPRIVTERFGKLMLMPLYYFLFGYVTMMGGTTVFFLNMGIGGVHTMGCLAFCTAVRSNKAFSCALSV